MCPWLCLFQGKWAFHLGYTHTDCVWQFQFKKIEIMQNQPLFYSLIEFHEVPWQKNWKLPVFCFSLLLACTWGIMFMKTRKKTGIPHNHHISNWSSCSFPLSSCTHFTDTAEEGWKNLKATRMPTPGSQDRQVQVWQPAVLGYCATTFSHFCAPIPGSVVWAPEKAGCGISVTPQFPQGKCLSLSPVPAQEVEADGNFCVHCRVSVLLFLTDILDELLEFIV